MTILVPESAETAKARGAFYTPPEITEFLSKWAVRSASDWILEPSAGDGAFLGSLSRRIAELSAERSAGGILAIERDRAEAQKSRAAAPMAEVRNMDFFDLDPGSSQRFTAVVGNPPYVRYQGFTGPDRQKALSRTRAQGVELTGLASSWAHFVVHASSFLSDGGRLAMVLPAELLHADYAGPIRALLTERFSSVTVIAFDRAAFAAQVDAVLLLASDDGPAGFRVIRAPDVRSLSTLDLAATPISAHTSARWSGLVDADAGDIYREATTSGLGRPLGVSAHVDIGFVSGANDFFILTAQRARDLRLPDDVLRAVVRRPSDVPGLTVRNGEAQYLVDLSRHTQLDEPTHAYILAGELQGFHQRYKCRSRSPWYAVPLPKRKPDAFLPYMHHLGPRLIVNPGGLRNSNLLHGVALKPGAAPAEAIAVAMSSSLTLLSAEIEGRSYGGGVLKLETKEAERLLIPAIANARPLAGLVPVVDDLVRQGRVLDAARMVDDELGLPHRELWAAYETLRNRRLNRRRE